MTSTQRMRGRVGKGGKSSGGRPPNAPSTTGKPSGDGRGNNPPGRYQRGPDNSGSAPSIGVDALTAPQHAFALRSDSQRDALVGLHL